MIREFRESSRDHESVAAAEVGLGTIVGGYRLSRLLHVGDDGRNVFFAHDASDASAAVVIKLAPLGDRSESSRLEREFAVHRWLASARIVPALGYGISVPLQLEYLILPARGPSLAVAMATAPERRLPPEMALAIVHAAAKAVGGFHELGWVHGDLKPGNLLCDRDGGVVLADLEFAVSRHGAGSDRDTALHSAGTPAFMAPELWQQPSATKSEATDVWALGVTLYLALTGDYPFGSHDATSIRRAVELGFPAGLPDVPSPLRMLVMDHLAFQPHQRPADGHHSAAAIARFATELGYDLTAGLRSFAKLVSAVPAEFVSPDQAASTLRPLESGPLSTCSPPPNAPGTAVVPVRTLEPDLTRESTTAVAPSVTRPPGVGAASDSQENRIYRRLLELDIASQIAEPAARFKTPAAMPAAAKPSPTVAPAPAAVCAPAPATALKRQAAARWYRRMNPDRNFPLSVVVSGRQIRIVGGAGLGVAIGTKELVLDADYPVLSIEPWFPGCLVSPPQADVHCSQETTVCRFWITPLVCGELDEACVSIRYRGQIVETLSTPSRVVTRTTAKVLAGLGLVSPVAGKILHVAGLSTDDLWHQSVPLLGEVLSRLGPVSAGLLLTGGLLSAAFGYYYVTRPLQSEVEPGLLAPA